MQTDTVSITQFVAPADIRALALAFHAAADAWRATFREVR